MAFKQTVLYMEIKGKNNILFIAHISGCFTVRTPCKENKFTQAKL